MLGGPDDGNFVDSTVEEIKFKATFEWSLDGQGFDSKQVVYGRYIWDKDAQNFRWKLGLGPNG
jgi:hypothetical protein